MKLVGTEAMARIDSRSQTEFAIPSLILMENAGAKAWDTLTRSMWHGRPPMGPLVALAGAGNNGGDAYVMARHAFVEGVRDLCIVQAGGRPAPSSDPGINLAACEALGIACIPFPQEADQAKERIQSAAWLLDGIAGTGLRGALRAPLSDLAAIANSSRARVAAIDVPSGVGDGFRAGHPAVRADCTLTMGLPKLCLYLPAARPYCGRILVVAVGFPPSLVEDSAIPGQMLDERAWEGLAAPIPAHSHKGMRGHLAVFAGSAGTTGAAWLAANSAARSRVGLVSLFLSADAYPVLASRLTSVMAKPWDDGVPPGAGAFNPAQYTGILAGPGWGLGDGRARWLQHLVSLGLPGVIDADGLTLLSRMSEKPRLGGAWVLTPHPGEFSRLTGLAVEEVLADPVGHALAVSSALEAVIVLKGHCTCVAEPGGRYWILDGENPALATGGSGDVLAGIIAGAIGSRMPPLEAALFGVSLHARLGRIAAGRMGWFLAEDLVPMISRALGRSLRTPSGTGRGMRE